MISQETYNGLVKELKIQFHTIDVTDGADGRKLVEVHSKEMILETAKEQRYLHGAIMLCDNYSIKVENGVLVFIFGFQVM